MDEPNIRIVSEYVSHLVCGVHGGASSKIHLSALGDILDRFGCEPGWLSYIYGGTKLLTQWAKTHRIQGEVNLREPLVLQLCVEVPPYPLPYVHKEGVIFIELDAINLVFLVAYKTVRELHFCGVELIEVAPRRSYHPISLYLSLFILFPRCSTKSFNRMIGIAGVK